MACSSTVQPVALMLNLQKGAVFIFAFLTNLSDFSLSVEYFTVKKKKRKKTMQQSSLTMQGRRFHNFWTHSIISLFSIHLIPFGIVFVSKITYGRGLPVVRCYSRYCCESLVLCYWRTEYSGGRYFPVYGDEQTDL